MIQVTKHKKGHNTITTQHYSFRSYFLDDKIWLSKKELITLFEISKPELKSHIKTILLSEQYNIEDTIIQIYNHDLEKKEKFYSLDLILSLGYRSRKFSETRFVIKINRVLKNLYSKKPTLLEKTKNTFQIIRHEIVKNREIIQL